MSTYRTVFSACPTAISNSMSPNFTPNLLRIFPPLVNDTTSTNS